MPEYRQAEGSKRSYKKMTGMMIEKGANGGHTVTHMHKDGDGMTMPKANHFGPEDGKDGTTHAHIMDHLGKMGIMAEAGKEEHEGPASQVESASEPAMEDVQA